MTIRNCWPLYLLLIAFSVLGARLAWTLTVSTTGWGPHLDQWANVASSLVGIERPALSDRAPEQQATFWLTEVENIESATDDPQVAMGAAWMLDSPQFGFIRRHVRLKDDLDFPGMSASWRRELDYETIEALTEEFELQCRNECLARIKTAVRLDDANIELRRARALLLFQTRFMSLDSEPREEDWLATLDECAQKDPDNALYDYVAALHLWTASADYDWEEDGYILKIEDEETFKQGDARLAVGLNKPHLKFGTEGYAATMAFLDQSSISRPDHLTAAGSRQIDSRGTNLLYRIMRWQSVQLDVEKRADKFDAAVAAVRSVLRISDQISEVGNYPNLSAPKLILRQWSLANLEDMHEEHPDLLSGEEAETVSSELAEVQLDLEVLGEVGKRLAAKAGTPVNTNVSSGSPTAPSEHLLAVFLMVSAQMLVIVTVALALMSLIGARLFGAAGDVDQLAMGRFRHIAAWIFAAGISFVLLGMFPAGIVSPGVQAWMICGLIWVGFAALFLSLLNLFRKRFQIPWTQLAVLVTITALPVVALFHPATIIELMVGGAATLHPILSIILLLVLAATGWATFRFLSAFARNEEMARRRKFLAVGVLFLIALVAVPAGTVLGMTMSDELEAQAWFSPTVWQEARGLHMAADELQSAMKLEDSRWVWAVIQWQAHYGAIVTPLIAAVVLFIWHLIRRAQMVEGGLMQIIRSQKRRQTRLAGNAVAGSCLMASLVFSLLYLGATPTVADMMETHHRVHYGRMVNPSRGWAEIAEATVQIRSDETLMKRFQSEIDERNRRIAEQNDWLDE